MTGLDISREMLARLRARLAPDAPLQLAQGDACRPPFPDAVFDAAIAVHVFHLIPAWQQVMRQIKRVLKPEGILLHSFHRRDADSVNVMVRHKWRELVEARGEQWRRPGPANDQVISDEGFGDSSSVDRLGARAIRRAGR